MHLIEAMDAGEASNALIKQLRRSWGFELARVKSVPRMDLRMPTAGQLRWSFLGCEHHERLAVH